MNKISILCDATNTGSNSAARPTTNTHLSGVYVYTIVVFDAFGLTYREKKNRVMNSSYI